MQKFDEIPLKKGEPTESLDLIRKNLSGRGSDRHVARPFQNEARPPQAQPNTIVGPRTESLEILKQTRAGTYVAKSETPPLNSEVNKTDTLMRTRKLGEGMPGPKVYWNPGMNFDNPSPLQQRRRALLNKIESLDINDDDQLAERLRLRKEIDALDAD